jgi:Ca2+-binding EF-hand superfamily protein
VVLGNTEKFSRGAVKLGPGPLSKKERELLSGDSREESAVYDLHGRRHHLQEAGQVAKESALESAIWKVRRLVLDSGRSVDIFRQYDVNRSGTLSYTEFQRMLRAEGCGLTKEQSSAFFKRFDSDGSGEVDYRELLWGFFNWEAFLKRWHERKSASQTHRELKQAFERYDPAGRGVLPTKAFQLALDHLGVTVSDVDAKLLEVKFEAGQDDFINYHELLSSIADGQAPSANANHSTGLVATAGVERIWAELQDLAATQAKLHRLLRK